MKFYRYDSIGTDHIQVYLGEYELAKETPCGWRLTNGKFLLKRAKKKWAYPSLEEAKESFIQRKLKYIRLLEARLVHNRGALEIARTQQLPFKPGEFVSVAGPVPTVLAFDPTFNN